jgi:hypothetical protein
VSDPITVDDSSIDGDTLTLSLAYSGGCARHDLALCYVAAGTDIYPPTVSLQLLHDAHEDPCEGTVVAAASFDVSALGRIAGSAIVWTNYGFFAAEQPSCAGREMLASTEAQRIAEGTHRSCSRNEDCVRASIDTSCSAACGAVVSVDGADALAASVAAIDRNVCRDYVERGCGPVSIPPCVPPLPLRCQDGECVEVLP